MFKPKKSIGPGQIFTLLVLMGLLQPAKLNRRRFVGMSALGLAGAGLGSLGGMVGSLLGNKPADATPRTGQNPIQIENALPGNPLYDDGSGRAIWGLTLISDDPDHDPIGTENSLYQIKGYASATSINKGESIDLHVRVYNNKPYYMELFRVGWYNGDGARQLGSKIGPLPGQAHAIPAPDSFGMVACNWPVAYTLQTDPSWVSGHYLIKLTIDDTDTAGQYQNYIHFVLRDDAYHSDLLFKSSVTTYQAYNYFGGQSLYNSNSYDLGAAVKVSFDRPYAAEGCGDFLYWEIALVRFLESQGYDLSYATSMDLHTNPLLPFGHKGVISDGHDEYWTKEMFDNTIAARDWGINHAFFGANPCYWQIRMEPSASGVPNRVIVGYKDSAIPDPNNPGTPHDPCYDTAPELTTCRWREDPVNRPENQLLGVMYDNYFDWDKGYPYVVQNTSHWVYANTGFRDGDKVYNATSGFGIVGYEWDKEFNNGLTPANLTLLSASPVTGYNIDGTQANVATTSHSAIYQAASGAWVFASGTVYWGYGLDYSVYQSQDLTNAGIKQMTRNVLDRFISDYRLNPSVCFDWDDGSGTRPGTLSYALKNTTSGQKISFYLNGQVGSTYPIQPSQPLPAVPAGVTLDGGSCTAGNPTVIIDGSKEPAGTHPTGLTLSGGDTLRHIKVTNFGGTQITNSAGGNKFDCVVVSKFTAVSPSAPATAPRFAYRPVGRKEGSSWRNSRPRKK